jgi:hypothetical protein
LSIFVSDWVILLKTLKLRMSCFIWLRSIDFFNEIF